MSDDTRVPPAPKNYLPESVEFVSDPHAVLREMREAGGIHQRDDRLGVTRYVLTRYDDVQGFLRHRDHFLDVSRLPPEDPRRLGLLPEENRELHEQPSILALDDPEHGRLRNIVSRAFSPRAVDGMSPKISEIADELLDRVEGEDEIDFMRVLADPLPATVIFDMFGVAIEDHGQIKEWTLAINSSGGVESMGPRDRPGR